MEPPANTKPSKGFALKFKKLTQKPAVILLGAVLVIAVSVGGYFLIKNSFGNNGDYSYTYKDLNAYAMSGNAKGNGISLQKPVELVAAGSPSPGQTQAYLNHTLNKDSQQAVTIAQIFLATVNAGTELQAGYKKNIDTAITDPKSAGHEAVIKPIKDYVTQRLKTTLTTTFTEAKPLVTTNIKQSAWYLTFTATPKDSKDRATQPDISGEVILGIGKTTFYYIMVDSLSGNWQSNQKVWDQVINSVKLDQ